MTQSLIFKLALFGIYKGLDSTRSIALRRHSALTAHHPKSEILLITKNTARLNIRKIHVVFMPWISKGE